MNTSNHYILFNERIFNRNLHIGVTTSAINSLVDNNINPMHFCYELSTSNPARIFKVTFSDGGSGLKLYTKEGSLLLLPSQRGPGLSAVSFNEYNVRDENAAFAKGYNILFSGISICIKWHDAEQYALYYNGTEYETRSEEQFQNQCVSSAELFELFGAEDKRQERAQLREERRELSKLLDKAENYAELSSQLEQINAEKLGRINYFKFESLERNRIDRVAYRFTVDKKYEKDIKVRNTISVYINDNESIKGEVIGVSSGKTQSYIDLLFQDSTDDRRIPAKGYMWIEVNSVNLRVQKAAIDKIRDGSAKSTYMFNVLGKHQPAGFNYNDLSNIENTLLEANKNQSQITAVTKGINSKDIYLVMGPPGTGKTTVIVEWVKYFVERNQRVLISSQNNKAVDNVIERMGDEKDLDILRIGSEANLQDGVIPYMFENKISALRESIDYAVTENKKDFDEIIKAWMKYALQIKDSYLSKVELLEKNTNKAAELTDKYITPLYESLCATDKRLREINSSLSEKIKEIEIPTSRVNEVRKMGPILGAIFGLIWSKSIKTYNELEPQIQALQAERDVREREYEDVQKKHKIASDNYNSVVLPKLIEEQDYFRKKYYDRLIEKRPNQDEYGVFSDAYAFEPIITSMASWNTYLQTIYAAVKKSEAIEGIIVDWRDHVNSSQNYALNDLIMESVDLVGATCIGVLSQKRFSDLDFDVTIIDEAGQIQIQNALVPMSVSSKVIMLGDHKQIPPIADPDLVKLCESNEVETDLLEKSLFEDLYNVLPNDNTTLLDTQYRMPAEMADIISEWFYGGEYKSPDFKRNTEPYIPSLFNKNLVLIDTSKEPKRKDNKSPEGGYRNILEAEVIKALLKSICIDNEMDTNEVGVISAWNYQVETIKKELKGLFEPEQIRGMVASLDSFQGQERDVIIYSFTKSNQSISPKKRRIGFLNELRRLNVAISRCKKTLIMTGDFDFLTSCKHMNYDEYGNAIYEKSEAQFSDFIKLLVKRVNEGNGEIISVKDFYNRIGETKYGR